MLCPKCGYDAGETDTCPSCGCILHELTCPAAQPEAGSAQAQKAEQTVPADTPSPETAAPVVPKARFANRKKLLIGSAAGVVIVLLAVVLFVFSKPDVVSVSAKYNGETSAHIVLDSKNKGIIVTGEKKNGKLIDLSGWTIEEPQELKADRTTSVTIRYKDLQTTLNVRCSTSQALKISASYDGKTENGTVVTKDQIKVQAVLKNGKETDVSADCTFDPPSVTLETDGEYVIRIQYQDPVSEEILDQDFKLECSTLSIRAISASYSGSTKAGTLIDENNEDIVVTADMKNGTKKTLSGWKITKPAELKEDETVTVEITYDEYKTELSVICSDMSESKYKQSCQTISYDSLSRYPGKNKGKYIKVTGKVFQVISEAENDFYYSTYFIRSNGNLYLIRIDNYGSDSRIPENDTITVWGVFDEIYTYETVRGYSNSVPQITAKYYN